MLIYGSIKYGSAELEVEGDRMYLQGGKKKRLVTVYVPRELGR